MFRNLFKSWVMITVCHALLRSRFAEACQLGDMGLVWGLLFLIWLYEGNILNRDRPVLLRSVSFHSEALSP